MMEAEQSPDYNGDDQDQDQDQDHYSYPRGRHLVQTVGDDYEERNHIELSNACTNTNNYHDNVNVNDNDSGLDKPDGVFLDEPPPSDNHPSHSAIGSKRTPWYGTAIILLSEVMGTGILSLPYAARTLGWTSTLVSVPLFAAFASYAGWLLAKVGVHSPRVFHLEFHSYADASTTLLGRTFGQVTHVSMLLNWGATAIYYLIATADGMGDIFNIPCAYQRSMLAVALLVLPCQCRDFYAISKYLSGPSTCAIVIMVFVILGNLILIQESQAEEDFFVDVINATQNITFNDTEETLLFDFNDTDTDADMPLVDANDDDPSDLFDFGDSTTTWPRSGTTPLQYLEALSAFVFAYQGHAIFLELMAEMKDATQFPYACSMGYIIMCTMYALTVIVAYGLRGDQTEEFLPDILPNGKARQIVGILVCLHITVSYVIACQPLHMWLHSTLFPDTFQQESFRGTCHWFTITVGYLIFGFVIGNCIPFFADVQALIGSLFGAPSVFGWPVAFFVLLCHQQAKQQQDQAHQHQQRVSLWSTLRFMGGCHHLIICTIFLFVLTPLFCVLGTSGAIASIVRDAEDAGEPFQCD